MQGFNINLQEKFRLIECKKEVCDGRFCDTLFQLTWHKRSYDRNCILGEDTHNCFNGVKKRSVFWKQLYGNQCFLFHNSSPTENSLVFSDIRVIAKKVNKFR